MSDSLVLKGAKDVKKQKGSELLLLRPKRGGDFHQVKKWWAKSPNNTLYVGCSVFKVTTGAGTAYLAIDTNEMSTIRVDHDGSFNFSFFILAQVSRAALFTEDWEIIEHYMFPKIAKGPVTTVIPPGAASKPTAGPPAPTIGTVTITGATAVNDGDTESYTVSASGGASPSFVLTSSEGADVIAGLDVTFSGAGARTLTATATDAAASDSPATGTLAVNAAVLFATRVANADLSVAVTVADTGNGDKYQIDGVEQDEIVATVGSTIHFDMSDASTSGHPIAIYTDETKTTKVTVGIETDANSNDLIFTPPIAGTFSYQCTQHAAMGGTITVTE